MGGKIWVRDVAQGEYLPPKDPLLLSEKSVKSAAKMEITKYGSQAWGMADVDPYLRDRVQKWVKPRKSKVSGFPSPSLLRCSAAQESALSRLRNILSIRTSHG